MYFRNYVLRKTWLDNCLKKPFLEDLSRSNMVKRSKHCRNLKDSAIKIFVDQCQHWRKSLLILWKILRLAANTCTADEKYYLLNRANLIEPIPMQLSQKEGISA